MGVFYVGYKQTILSIVVSTDPGQVLPARMTTYNVRSIDDQKICNITGICILPNGLIIAADNNNTTVKLFSPNFEILFNYNVYSEPSHLTCLWDICLISDTEVAVTFDKHVEFLSVIDGEYLSRASKFTVPYEAVGIAHHERILYLSASIALYRYTLTGTPVQTMTLQGMLYEDTNTEPASVWRCAVSPTGDMIYVTDRARNRLLTLDMGGRPISTFTDHALQEPHGVCVTRGRQVLVCGCNSNTVIRVDHNGRTRLAQIDGVTKPSCVCSNTNNDQFIVGLHDNDTIIVMEPQ